MIGIIKSLFGGKDKYYAQLDESQATTTETQPTEAKPEETQPTPEPTPMAVVNKPQPPAMALKGETFAPNYLTPKPTPFRRRPGANLESFKALAREMNTPSNQ